MLSAIDDPNLIQELKVRSTGLELNPTSNVRTGVCPSFAAHPLRRYFDAGLLVTINSDDPAFFGSDIANEYLLAHTEQGFTRDELRQLAANSMRASFLPAATQDSWLSKIAQHILIQFGTHPTKVVVSPLDGGSASKESWAMIDIGDQSNLCLQNATI